MNLPGPRFYVSIKDKRATIYIVVDCHGILPTIEVAAEVTWYERSTRATRLAHKLNMEHDAAYAARYNERSDS